jgi:hypothetical protein
MTAEEDRREGPGRRLTDNQLLEWRKEGEAVHAEIEADISGNSKLVAEVKDDVTMIRSELAEFHEDSCRQFAGIGDCINDLKAWQHNYERRKATEIEKQVQRDQRDEAAYAEILSNFRFQQEMKARALSAAKYIAAIGGAIGAIALMWEHMKHLFTHGSP